MAQAFYSILQIVPEGTGDHGGSYRLVREGRMSPGGAKGLARQFAETHDVTVFRGARVGRIFANFKRWGTTPPEPIDWAVRAAGDEIPND